MNFASESPIAARRDAPILGAVCGGRDNNLNLIRMIAASAVLVSHAVLLTRGHGAMEPLQPLTGYSLGWVSVAVFFVISGFLIARSFDRRVSGRHWFAARVLRLYPGLLVMLVLTVAVLGPLATTLPPARYWSDPATWTYLPYNAALAKLQYPLPGVFAELPVAGTINGSLWTLLYEVICYGGVFVAGIVGALRRPRLFAVGLAGFLAIYLYVFATNSALGLPPRFTSMYKLAFPFSLGMAAYVWRDRLRLDWRVAGVLWALAVAAWFTPAFTQFYILALAYSALVLAYRPKGALLHYNRVGDYSYGLYIYAHPIQQLMIHLFPGQQWPANILLSYPVALVAAILSWHLVEKRALALVRPAAERPWRFWRREGMGTVPQPDGGGQRG